MKTNFSALFSIISTDDIRSKHTLSAQEINKVRNNHENNNVNTSPDDKCSK